MALLACLQVSVAMELGQLRGIQAATTMKTIYILADSKLHKPSFVKTNNSHVGGGGEGFQKGDPFRSLWCRHPVCS